MAPFLNRVIAFSLLIAGGRPGGAFGVVQQRATIPFVFHPFKFRRSTMTAFLARFLFVSLELLLVLGPHGALAVGGYPDVSRRNWEAAYRDKTGTTTNLENNTGSQGAAPQQLASRVSFEAEGTRLVTGRFRILRITSSLRHKRRHCNKLRNAGHCWLSPDVADC